MLLYVSLIVALGARNVAYNALTTKVPRPHERARFLSLQSTVYHAVAGAAAWLSTSFLRQLPDGRLEGIPRARGGVDGAVAGDPGAAVRRRGAGAARSGGGVAGRYCSQNLRDTVPCGRP